MFHRIGKKKEVAADLVGALTECHDRIRFFLDLADRIASSESAPPHQVAEAAARVRRYFEQALVLHVADEEETILPRLRGRDPGLDEALDRMSHEHRGHAPQLERMLSCIRELEVAPERLGACRVTLASASQALGAQMRAHLEHEERVIFPALTALPREEREAMHADVRARREARRSP